MNQHLQDIENCQPFKSHPRQFHDRLKVSLKLLLHCFATYDLSEINKFHRNSPKLKRNIEALRTMQKLSHFWTLKYSDTFPSCFPIYLTKHLHQRYSQSLLALLMDCTLGTIQLMPSAWIPKGRSCRKEVVRNYQRQVVACCYEADLAVQA